MHNSQLFVENIGVEYGKGKAVVKALDQITIDFTPGKVTLIMGPSGSGKTTLLSILGCLLTPDRGQAYVMGKPITTLSETVRTSIRRDHIGYIFQAFRLFRSLSALENVLIALEISGYKGYRAKEISINILKEIGLGDKLHLKPSEMSGGEKQRVAIARAMVNNPSIILADEPTASLDSKSGTQIGEILLRLAEKEQRIVVVVSHDPRLISFAHRKIVLQDGCLIEDQEVN